MKCTTGHWGVDRGRMGSTNMVMEGKLVILQMFEMAMDMHTEFQSADIFHAFCRDQAGETSHENGGALDNDLKVSPRSSVAQPPAV